MNLPDIPTLVAVCLGSYLMGAIPMGVLVGRRYGVDVRKHGSGNIGFTNVLRVLGWKPGLFVFLFDVLKGLAPALAAGAVCGPEYPLIPAMAGAVAILGHSFSVFLGFEGGKGISTTLGAAFGVHPLVALLCFLTWLAVTAVTRYVSLGSVVGVWMIPVFMRLFSAPKPLIIWGAGIAMFATLRHHANIRRLLRGEEPKFGRRSDATKPTEGE